MIRGAFMVQRGHDEQQTNRSQAPITDPVFVVCLDLINYSTCIILQALHLYIAQIGGLKRHASEIVKSVTFFPLVEHIEQA